MIRIDLRMRLLYKNAVDEHILLYIHGVQLNKVNPTFVYDIRPEELVQKDK